MFVYKLASMYLDFLVMYVHQSKIQLYCKHIIRRVFLKNISTLFSGKFNVIPVELLLPK